MAKGDDSIQKKKNKAAKKKLHRKENPSSVVSARVASIIAAKKRRHTGKRRMCQGMCFSLPSLDDPFNDRQGKKYILMKKKTKKVSKDYQAKRALQEEKKTNESSKDVGLKETTTLRDSACGEYFVSCSSNGLEKKTVQQQGGCPWDWDGPSKFLMLCLKTIENSLLTDGDGTRSPLFLNSWGVDFWKLYETGKDIFLETSKGVSSSTEQISWIVSTAADSIAKKEKEGLSFTTPFLLYLVPTKEKSAEVRSICKYLKALGVHIVSIHGGASLDHQIQGLKSCEPEFLVSTPERLLELISVKAVDISGISLLVVDGTGSTSEGTFHDSVKSIRDSISGNPHTIVFNDYHCGVSSLRDHLRRESIQRLCVDNSVSSLSSCIVQSVHVVSRVKDKLSRSLNVLDEAWKDGECGGCRKVAYIVWKDKKLLVAALKKKGYSISDSATSSLEDMNSGDAGGGKRFEVAVLELEQLADSDDLVKEYDTVLMPDFVPAIDIYVGVLTKMARYSVHGVLHSFISEKEDSQLVQPLIKILQQCGQTVPKPLSDKMMEE